jgi:hypothetical protein
MRRLNVAMRPTNTVQRWLRLPSLRKRLLVEGGIALACMAWRVRHWRFERLAATLGTLSPAMQAKFTVPDGALCKADLAWAREVRWAIAAWTRVLRGQPTCLMQAAAAQSMLARRGIPSALVFGVQSATATAAVANPQHALGAHAWLRCGALIVTGEQESANFRPIAAYHLAPKAGSS